LAGGAPLGNKNATKNKPLTEAIQRALLAEDGKKLRALADALVDRAIEKDTQAAREVLDRVEGKVAQALEHSGPGGEPVEAIINVRFGDGSG
jgi:hypothetical protein